MKGLFLRPNSLRAMSRLSLDFDRASRLISFARGATHNAMNATNSGSSMLYIGCHLVAAQSSLSDHVGSGEQDADPIVSLFELESREDGSAVSVMASAHPAASVFVLDSFSFNTPIFGIDS